MQTFEPELAVIEVILFSLESWMDAGLRGLAADVTLDAAGKL